MRFTPGDPVHVAHLGKGVVRQARNGGRYLVEIKGRALVVSGSQLTPVEPTAKPRRGEPEVTASPQRPSGEPGRPAVSLDLHGLTVPDALEAVSAFLNTALLDGLAEVRIIHGRSGGKLKAAVHGRLKELSSIRGFGLDPGNQGVTIVRL